MIQSKIEIAMSTISFPTINILLTNYSNPLSHFFLCFTLYFTYHGMSRDWFVFTIYYKKVCYEIVSWNLNMWDPHVLLWEWRLKKLFHKIVFYLLHPFPQLAYVVKTPHHTRHTKITLKTKATNIITRLIF